MSHSGSSEPTLADLRLIHSAVRCLGDLEGQDEGLIIEMSQMMLSDILEGHGLAPMADYVNHYCDVIDSPQDADRIVASIHAPED